MAQAVTVEEGEKAILECPGFVPNPQDRREEFAIFSWYKAKVSDIFINGKFIHHNDRVAVYDKSDETQFTYGDLKGRATVDGTPGALEIHQTRVSDGNFYTCYFIATASGDIFKETQVVITGECFPVYFHG